MDEAVPWMLLQRCAGLVWVASNKYEGRRSEPLYAGIVASTPDAEV